MKNNKKNIFVLPVIISCMLFCYSLVFGKADGDGLMYVLTDGKAVARIFNTLT
jgi:hypothetical protein